MEQTRQEFIKELKQVQEKQGSEPERGKEEL